MPTDSSEKSPGFSLFMKFPLEIQDYIWDIAARPFPGSRLFHTFFAVDHYFDQKNDTKILHGDALRFKARGTVDNGSFGLLVPWGDPDGVPNTSAYKATSGLWMACQASRKAMERRYPRNEWWTDLPGPRMTCPHRHAKRGDFLTNPDASHTASYIDRYGNPNHITISAGDIVRFATPSNMGGLDTIDWFYHYAGDHVPLLDERAPEKDPKTGDAHPSFVGMDIALDFDPRWFTWLPSSLVDMVDVFHNNTARKVWFIDHRLRQRQTPETVREEYSNRPKDLESFYSCGYVFTEVRERHLDLWEIDGEHNTLSMFDFFLSLADMHNGRLEEIDGSTRIGVLACEANPRDPSIYSMLSSLKSVV